MTMSASPTNSPSPAIVQFFAQGTGGNVARAPYDTTDDLYGTITAQGDNSPNEIAANAFDGTTSTKWLDFANADPSKRSTWIQYQYANGRRCVVSRYTVSAANDATAYPQRNPRTWRLLASNNTGDSWATLDVQSNQVFTANYQTLSYAIANTNAYNLYRFQIDSVSNAAAANSMQLSELQFIGNPVYTYAWTFGDGGISAAQNPQHTYVSNGTYMVTVSVSDGAGGVTRTMQVNVLPLVLSCSPGVGNSLILTWPNWAASFGLYSATNLLPAVTWVKVTNAVVDAGGLFRVSVPVGSDNRFFQLRPN
jgi:PKD repeat protein